MTVFAVTILHGPRFDEDRGLREQDGWDEHAAFMDGLVAEGVVVLGGPIGDGSQALVVMEVPAEREVHRRYAADPWIVDGTLRIGHVEPWTIWLDGTRRDPPLT